MYHGRNKSWRSSSQILCKSPDLGKSLVNMIGLNIVGLTKMSMSLELSALSTIGAHIFIPPGFLSMSSLQGV